MEEMDWQRIETAPKDGRLIRYQRVIDGRVAFEGVCRWGVRGPDAPARRPFSAYSPGFGLLTLRPDGTADVAAWINESDMYLVPDPTHWQPFEAST